jgi:hypothetical protein
LFFLKIIIFHINFKKKDNNGGRKDKNLAEKNILLLNKISNCLFDQGKIVEGNKYQEMCILFTH